MGYQPIRGRAVQKNRQFSDGQGSPAANDSAPDRRTPDCHPLFRDAPGTTEFNKLRKRLIRQTREAISYFSMVKPGARWLVALSGGKDSYALLALLAVLSTWLFYEGRSDSWRARTGVLYVAVNIAGTFTHIWFFFLLFAQIASFLLLGDKREAKRFGLAMTLSLAPYSLVWLPTFLRQLSGSSEKAAWLSRPGLGDVGSVLFLYGGVLWLLLPILLIAWRKGGKPLHFVLEPCRANPELVFILLTALGVPFLISFFKPVFYSRFTIVVLPLFALIAGALGARAVGETGRRQLVWLLIVISAAVGLTLRLMGNQCDSRWTAKYLASHVQEGDVVIFTSLSRLPTDYYLKRLKPQWSVWETSFPGEIDQHPGYEGSALKPGQQPRLRREADRLVGRIEASMEPGRRHRIFFLHGYRPETDRILKARLDKRFQRADSDCIQCRVSRSYYRRISVYQIGRSQTAGGRMQRRPGS